MFKIVKGELVLPEGCEDRQAAWRLLWTEKVARPESGQSTVVVADADDQLVSVPSEGEIISVGGRTHIDLFRAIDEDNGGQEVIIAWDWSSGDSDDERHWLIVPHDRWVQTPHEKCLVRYFAIPEEAVACLGEDKIALQQVEDVAGWRCVLIHACRGLLDWDDLDDVMCTPKFMEMFQIPDGIDIASASALCLVTDILQIDAAQFSSYHLQRVRFTRRGEVFVCMWMKESRAGTGLRVLSRLFTYDETRERLKF